MEIQDVKNALKYTDWTKLLYALDGEEFAIVLNGQPALAAKASSVDKEDSDYDRDLEVVVEVSGRFFRKTGWSQTGSHCYGDYEPSWESDLTEVTPHSRTVTVYDRA